MIGIPVNNKKNPEDVWQENFRVIKSSMNEKYGKKIINDIFEYYVDEIGIEKIIDFLKIQDKIEQFNEYNFISYGNIFFEQRGILYKKITNKKSDDDDGDENDLIVNKKNTEYDFELIKSSLFRYFIQEMVEDIPEDSILRDEQDVNDFIKMYEVKFLYEFVIPISEINDMDKRKIN